MTPLHHATCLKNYSKEIGELLISKGADVNAIDIIYLNILILFLIRTINNLWKQFHMKNQTPLHSAALNNSKEMSELLISKGADINAIDIIYRNFLII